MDEIERLLLAYRSKGLLLDSNLLLVYLIGLWNPQQIQRFKRTAAFSIEDFELLVRLVRFFDKVVTTPNILTEVNSLSNQLSEDFKPTYYSRFSEQITLLNECYVPSQNVASMNTFARFGLTDCGIEELTRNNYLVLTDDLRLSVHLQTTGIDALNFNHLRVLNWQ